eukprot:TRINITY_DN18773_c0_g1_i1.p1 TRINITY_DN18773_c0_g1~~TRINITY_DN18773_c0_g1_i1.p1  ORF type:complete len:570 (+),score=146.06 TRINITY_DN18773_c0_g1_i1:33-1712(+)
MAEGKQRTRVLLIAGMFSPRLSDNRHELVHYANHLTVDDSLATVQFLVAYFASGKNAAFAKSKSVISPVTLAGPYLQYTLENAGFEVVLINDYADANFPKMEEALKDIKVVVISTTFYYATKQLDTILRHVRRVRPDAVIIVGGMLLWKSYKIKLAMESGQYPDKICEEIRNTANTPEGQRAYGPLLDPKCKSLATVLIINPQGEKALIGILQRLQTGEDWRDLDSICYEKQDTWVINKIADEPYVSAWCDYSAFAQQNGFPRMLPVHVGHGCNFGCAYCDFCKLFPKIYLDSVEDIVAKLARLPLVQGRRWAYFTNDNLFQSKAQALTLCKAFVEANLQLFWISFQRVWIVDEELAEWMKRSGCCMVLAGIESGSEAILRAMGKPPNTEQTLMSLKLLALQGIHTMSSFICGFPGETDDTLKDTVNVLNRYYTGGPGLCMYKVFPFRLEPMSRCFSEEFRKKYEIDGALSTWKHSTMTSEQAVQKAAWLYTQVKDSVLPYYDDAFPLVLPCFLGEENFRNAVLTRNKLAHALKAKSASEEEVAVMWSALQRYCTMAKQ